MAGAPDENLVADPVGEVPAAADEREDVEDHGQVPWAPGGGERVEIGDVRDRLARGDGAVDVIAGVGHPARSEREQQRQHTSARPHRRGTIVDPTPVGSEHTL